MKQNQPLIDESLVNHIVNITVVDGWLNKNKIKAKAPSDYMGEFEKLNPNIKKDMEVHLITDFNKFGITNNDYNAFFTERIKLIHSEMISRLIKRNGDDFKFDYMKWLLVSDNKYIISIILFVESPRLYGAFSQEYRCIVDKFIK